MRVRDESFESVSKDFATDFAALKNDVARLAGLVGDLARSQADTAKANVSGVVDQARGSLTDTTDVLGEKALEATRRVKAVGEEIEAAVERNPLTALLIAVLGGMLIGMMSRSRR